MPKKILPYALAALTLVAAVLSWWSVYRAVNVAEAGNFLVPLIAFSFYAVSISLATVLVKEGYFLAAVLGVSMFSGLFFVAVLYHGMVIMAAFFILLWSKESIRSDLESGIKINLGRSLHRGVHFMVLALSVAIVSQYFFTIRHFEADRLVPRLERTQVTNRVITVLLERINPEFRQVEAEELTVDQFLEAMFDDIQQKEIEEGNREAGMPLENVFESGLGENLSVDQKEALSRFFEEMKSGQQEVVRQLSQEERKIFIQTWKNQISEMVGFEIGGDEKVADIFVVILNSRINELVRSRVDAREASPFFPMIMAMALFFVLYPLGSVLSYFWIAASRIIFWILKKTGAVKIVTVSKEAEEIA